ncbi:MAG: hypothetical protein MR352_07095, partial [Ruminococcus sp.]
MEAYNIQNVYPTKSGFENSFKFVSLGKVDGDPYVPPTTEPPTTTAPYTVSVGEGSEFYLAGVLGNWSLDNDTKMTYNPANNTFEKTYILNKGNYGFQLYTPNYEHSFGFNGAIEPGTGNAEFSIPNDNSKVKFVFDGIKVRMYINEQGVTTTTLPPTTTSTTVPSTTTTTTTSTTVPSTSVTTSTTVPDTSVSETASVPSTPTIPTVTAGTL